MLHHRSITQVDAIQQHFILARLIRKSINFCLSGKWIRAVLRENEQGVAVAYKGLGIKISMRFKGRKIALMTVYIFNESALNDGLRDAFRVGIFRIARSLLSLVLFPNAPI